MKEKKQFGKKPVRRSTPQDSKPARTYKPRTANRPILKDSEDNERKADFKPRKSTRPQEQTQRGRAPKDKAPLYLPRTAKGFKRDEPKRDETYNPRTSRKKEEKHDSQSPKSFYEEKFGKKPLVLKKVKPEEPIERKPLRLKKRDENLPPEYDTKIKTDKEGFIRLNKFIANSGVCSRREADDLIAKGHISVNGEVVTLVGTKVQLTDKVTYKGKELDPEKKVYILLNKPKDYVTTVDDPHATRTVMELIEGACDQRVYPVGRLDRNSTGLLLFTNDGEITKKLTHPSFLKRKIYEVRLDKNVTLADMNTIREGIEIEGEMVVADAVEYVDATDKSIVGIEIHSGQNRIVRRIFEKLEYRVYRLDRVYFAGLTKKNLPRGKWRFLTQKEVNMLKMNRF